MEVREENMKVEEEVVQLLFDKFQDNFEK